MEYILIIVGSVVLGMFLLGLGQRTAEIIQPALPSLVYNFVKSVISGLATYALTGEMIGFNQAGYFGLIVGILVFIVTIWKDLSAE